MVDALASGASVRKDVEVRVFSWAPKTLICHSIAAAYGGFDKFNPPPIIHSCNATLDLGDTLSSRAGAAAVDKPLPTYFLKIFASGKRPGL